MNYTMRYAALSAFLFLLACGACALGFTVAGDYFSRPAAEQEIARRTASLPSGAGSPPESPLLGADPDLIARDVTPRHHVVEVVDAVNMRQGPSSANAVIKVQIAGTTLQVASRQGKWVEVIEPETGGTGWVYGDYVKPVPPVSRRAEAADKMIR